MVGEEHMQTKKNHTKVVQEHQKISIKMVTI